MTNFSLYCVSILVLVAAAAPALSAERAANAKHVSTEADCEAVIQKLDASPAEGEERLAEKQRVIEACSSQYKNDKTIEKLVKDCAKYAEQPVLKQQFVADCQLAAFNYANALNALKAEYRK
jgi:hypothetical protein